MSTTPTATPLYIPPSHFVQPPVQQLPVQPPAARPAPVQPPPVRQPPVQPPPVQPPIQRPQPKRETAKPQTLQSVPGSPSVYPQPYSDFLQHQPVQRPSSSLGQPLTFPQTPEPTTRTRSAFSPPSSKVPGANQLPQATTLIPVPGKICPQGQLPQPCDIPSAGPAQICPITQTETSYTEESMSSMESEAFRKKMSICSQEISSITDHKALSSKFEALSESLDTQMMVSSLSEAQEFDRPASPTPSKDTSPPVPRNSLVPESSQFEAVISSQTIKPVQEEPCVKVTANESKPTSTKLVTFNPQEQVQSMQIRETKRTVVEESSSQSTQISQTKSVVKQQTTARRESGGSSETKSSVTKQQSSSIAQQSSSSVSTVKSVGQQESGSMSSITDNAPPQSQLLAALTTAPTRPYSPLPSATAAPTASTTTPAQPSKPYKEAPKPSTGFKPIAQTQQQESLQEIQQKSSTTSLVAALTIAPDRPYSPLPSAAPFGASVPLPKPVLPFQPKADIAAPRPEACQSPMVAALTIAPERSYSPLPGPAQIVNPVPKPIPSQPKTDVVVPRPEACQSPMISALTIAPERPYSPLPAATKSQETVPVQTLPQTEPPLLPVSSGRISMLSALTIAPDSPYSALPPATQAPFSATTQTQKKQETSAFKSVPQRKMEQAPVFTPIMAPSKPAVRFLPPGLGSSFLPITAESAPRPVTPVPHIPAELQQPGKPAGLPVPAPARSRSATPSQPRRPGSATGLQKPATIPYYQQQMLEYPFQPPRSATPISCPMISDLTSTQTLAPHDAATIPRLRSPSPSLRGWHQESAPQPPDTISQLPKGPAAPSQIQPQPKPLPQTVQKPGAPQPLQKPVVLQQAPNISQQPPQKGTAPQSQPLPFPNIPLPQGTARKLPATQANIPAFKPPPMDLPAPKFAPQSTAAPLASSIETKIPVPPNASTVPSAGGAAPGGGGSKKGAAFAGATAPRRGRGVLNQPTSLPAGARIPLCGHCNGNIRGPFITALGKIWCPEHFVCVNAQCRRQLADIGFVEEQGGLYCEYCFEQYLAPPCDKCTKKIKGDCVNAIGKHYHPECFVCAYCSKLFGNNPFFLEDGLPYCETDWNELFTTKCFACGFPIEAGDRWVEALSNNYHSQCFNCTSCKKNLEGQSFFAKGGRPFCKTHAR